MSSIFTEKNWKYYLGRPFSLFSASIWNYWYSSKQILDVIGTSMQNSIMVETHPNFVRNYKLEEELNDFQKSIAILAKDKAKIKRLLRIGLELNEEASFKLLNKNILSFEEEVEFLVKVAIHSTIIPYYVYEHFSQEDEELTKLCERLRATSFYPSLVKEVIIPLAEKKLMELGIKDSSIAIELITLSELISKNVSFLSKRKEMREQNFFFIYQYVNNKEVVEWTKDPAQLVVQLDHEKKMNLEIVGRIAFAGIVTGHARLVLTNDFEDKLFNKGDILVAVSTNPKLTQLIAKSGGIITDEGGMMCHAAIIARELQKPCIVGTTIATSMITDGDLIELDATKGTIKILHEK